jgi:tripartite-type tricarboxylate transporter receptor subunit TctC
MNLASKIVAAAALWLAAGGAAADTYPSRPIHFIVPFPPGGPADLTARPLGAKLAEAWGQPVVVENRTGAGGMIGTDLVAKAPPDGYTIGISVAADAITIALYPHMPYDTLRDLRAVCTVSISPFILVAHPSLKVHTLDELIALARKKPGQIGFASGGVGLPSHMAGELLNWRAHIDLLHVPYKGQGPATADVLAGQVPLMFISTMNGLPFIRDGKLNALAVSMPQRVAAVPEVPTMAEAGLPGFEVGTWLAILVPAATPADIVHRLAGAFERILQQPDVRALQAAQGADAVFEGPDAVAARQRADIVKWREVVKAANIHPE